MKTWHHILLQMWKCLLEKIGYTLLNIRLKPGDMIYCKFKKQEFQKKQKQNCLNSTEVDQQCWFHHTHTWFEEYCVASAAKRGSETFPDSTKLNMCAKIVACIVKPKYTWEKITLSKKLTETKHSKQTTRLNHMIIKFWRQIPQQKFTNKQRDEMTKKCLNPYSKELAIYSH